MARISNIFCKIVPDKFGLILGTDPVKVQLEYLAKQRLCGSKTKMSETRCVHDPLTGITRCFEISRDL